MSARGAIRLFHGQADGLSGLVIERWGPVLITQVLEGLLDAPLEEVRQAVESLHVRLETKGVYLKRFPRTRTISDSALDATHREPTPWIGQAVDPEFIIEEGPLRFLIRPYDGYSVGLFLEHRLNRRRVERLARDRRVLNLFAYTCGFSVAAAHGGGKCVDSVDLSKRYLEWGKQNFQANDIDLSAGRFFCSDVREYFKRAMRQEKRYDLIVIDPPTFAKMRRPHRVFVLKDELESLVAGALEMLDPKGFIFLATNDRQISNARMIAALTKVESGRRGRIIEHPELPLDFAGDPDFSKSLIAQYE